MYLEAGYTPLPLPVREKFPPPFGWTGSAKKNSGKLPAKGQCETWEKDGFGPWKAGNIALRLPKNVIGIDVDMYDGKEGRASLLAAEERWGPLPKTWKASSRADGSGILLFRIPEGLAWASEIGPGIEIIRWDHRYAVVCPSVHPATGERYEWIEPDGNIAADYFPGIDELEELPDAWVNGLTGDRQVWKERPEAELTRAEVSAWVEARPDGDACSELTGTLERGLKDIAKGGKEGGLHEAGLKAVWGVLRDAAHGHPGARGALGDLRAAFLKAAEKRSKVRKVEAAAEWFRIVDDGVRKTAAGIAPSDEDVCAAVGESWNAAAVAGKDIPGQYYPTTDIGNALRFHALFGEDVRWNPSEDRWLRWDGVRWVPDRVGLVEALAKRVPEYVEHTEAPKFDGDNPEWFKALKKHAKDLGRRGVRMSMLEDLKSMRDMTVVPEQLNADERLLMCGTRLVELAPDGARTRLPLREDYQTFTTKADFEPDATPGAWGEFLKRVLPDDEVRHWVQKAVGYSLFGRNPERKIFFIKGTGNNGKSVFAEVLTAILGDYAGTFDMTLFRAQKEQGPNVQLVRLLDKRVVFSSETSEERYLHADQLKRAAGSDTMSARLNRSNDMVSRVPAFTAWIMTNQAPTIRGADRALYKRLVCIPFDEVIPDDEVDPMLPIRLSTEGAAGVLAWAVAGWTAYVREGLADIPTAVALATMKLRGELSEFDMWITEECNLSGDAAAKTDDLYTAYRIWCEEGGVKDVESKIHFGRMLGARFEQTTVREGPRSLDRKQRAWKGIELKTG